MHLERIAEHDKNHNRCATNGRCHVGHVLSHYVAYDIVAECEVASDRNKYVRGRGSTNTCSDYCCCASRAGVVDLVKNGKHL